MRTLPSIRGATLLRKGSVTLSLAPLFAVVSSRRPSNMVLETSLEHCFPFQNTVEDALPSRDLGGMGRSPEF